MDLHFTPYVVPLLAASGLSAVLARLAWRRRSAPGARAFAVQMGGLAWWTFAYSMELVATDLAVKVIWAKARYPGTLLAVWAWLAVCLHYAGHGRWLTVRRALLLAVVPAVTLVLVATNEHHGLIWRSIEKDASSAALATVHGPWFWVHVGHSYLALLAGTLLVLRTLRSTDGRREAAPLLVSVLVPWAANVLDLAGLNPSRVDLTPFGLALSSVGFAWVLLHLRFLEIVPDARAAVVDAMSDGMVVLDADNRVAELNPAARRILAAGGPDPVGRPAGQVFGPWPDLLARFRDVTDASVEVAVRQGEDTRDYDLHVSPLLDRRGRVGGRVLVFRDVTERNRAESERQALFQAVADEHNRLLALIHSTRDGILLVGENGRLVVLNQSALQLLGLPGLPAEWLGRTAKDVTAELREHAFGAVAAVRATAEVGTGEGEYEASKRIVSWQSLPVSVGTQSLGRLLVLRDVTEERLLERLREDLTNTMVHDLRNPLTAISGSLELLESGSPTPRQAEILRMARSSTDRMLRLVNAILDVSRLESGRMPLDRQRLELREVVAETISMLAPLAGERGLVLEARLDGAPAALADAGLVARVFDNLVGNALKFTPRGGVVRVAAAPDGRGMLVVAVADSGPGIPADIRGRLFQKFVTGRQTGSGSGLGLAFCRLAVEAHGGRIWVESAPQKGATFSFTLPLAEG